jgi:hypothetical protein
MSSYTISNGAIEWVASTHSTESVIQVVPHHFDSHRAEVTTKVSHPQAQQVPGPATGSSRRLGKDATVRVPEQRVLAATYGTSGELRDVPRVASARRRQLDVG